MMEEVTKWIRKEYIKSKLVTCRARKEPSNLSTEKKERSGSTVYGFGFTSHVSVKEPFPIYFTSVLL